MLPLLQAAHAKGGASRQDLLQLIADICTKSRQLVKNQHTWFRDDDMFAWQDVSSRVRAGRHGHWHVNCLSVRRNAAAVAHSLITQLLYQDSWPHDHTVATAPHFVLLVACSA